MILLTLAVILVIGLVYFNNLNKQLMKQELRTILQAKKIR